MAITAEQALPGAVSPPRGSRTARFAGYPFVAPALMVVLAVMSYPFVYSVYLSFRSTPSYTTATTFAGLIANVLHGPREPAGFSGGSSGVRKDDVRAGANPLTVEHASLATVPDGRQAQANRRSDEPAKTRPVRDPAA